MSKEARYSMFDSRLLGQFYSTDKSREIYSDEATINTWCKFWAALAQAQEEQGIIPKGVAEQIRKYGKAENFDFAWLEEKIIETNHPCIPAIWALEKMCENDLGKWTHWGATLQDLLDTSYSLGLKEMSEYYISELTDVVNICLELAKKYRDDPMAGRTHQVHAVPITFGLKCAVYADELSRSLVRLKDLKKRGVFKAAFSGAAGALNTLEIDGHDGIAVQKRLAEILDLTAPTVSWHNARDTFVEFASVIDIMCGSCSRIMEDLRGLMKTELSEVAEDFPAGRLASSTMPQKRNPDTMETAIGYARIVHAQYDVAIDSMHIQHERCNGMMFLDTYYTLEINHLGTACLFLTRDVLENLHVFPQNMLRNLDYTNGSICAEAMMIKLGSKIGRMDAHHVVYENAMKAVDESRGIESCLLEDSRVTSIMSAEEIHATLQPKNYTGMSGKMVDKVIKEVGERIK